MGGSVKPDPLLTVDDIIRSGACIEGTYKTLRRVGHQVRSAMKASEIVKLLKPDERGYVEEAAQLNGYGYGDGYGDGYGNGDGDGYGNGDGDGDGYGWPTGMFSAQAGSARCAPGPPLPSARKENP